MHAAEQIIWVMEELYNNIDPEEYAKDHEKLGKKITDAQD